MVHLLARRRGKPSAAVASCLHDAEFGDVRLIRNDGSSLRLNVRTNGEIVISAPRGVGLRRIELFLEQSRDGLRRSLRRIDDGHQFSDGERIGRYHHLELRAGLRSTTRLSDDKITVTLARDLSVNQRQQLIRRAVARALKSEAQHYLPKRLHYLAIKTDYHYQRVRLTYAKSRWGSCSSNGTISLNIALMQLPEPLSDYVLMHELTHTKHMNHGVDFWQALELAMPGARRLSRELRQYSPYIN